MSSGDAPSATRSILIAAPPERVWDLIIDVTLLPRFSDELQSVEWVDGVCEPAVGGEFLGTNRHPAMGVWTTRSRIVACDPRREFAWAVGNPEAPAATWRFALAAETSGTSLTYTVQIGPGRSGVTMMIARDPKRAEEVITHRLAQFTEAMTATLKGIKEMAEHSAISNPGLCPPVGTEGAVTKS